MANGIIKLDNSMSTATLKAKFNSLESGTSLVFEPGVYEIDDVLKINGGSNPLANFSILAEQPYTVTIRQTTSNKGIFDFDQDTTHTWLIEGLILEWSTLQTSSQTSAVAVAFSNIDSGNGFFNGKISNCVFRGGFRGVSIEGATGQIPVWNTKIENCDFRDFAGRSISLASPSAIGMPSNAIENVSIRNDATSNSEDQIYLSGQSAMNLRNLTLEGSTRRVIYADSSVLTIDGLHLANLALDEADPVLFFLANSGYDIRTVSLSGEVLSSGFATVFRGFAGASVVVSGFDEDLDLTSGKKLYLFQGTNASPAYTLIGKTFSDNGSSFEVSDTATASYVTEL